MSEAHPIHGVNVLVEAPRTIGRKDPAWDKLVEPRPSPVIKILHLNKMLSTPHTVFRSFPSAYHVEREGYSSCYVIVRIQISSGTSQF